MELHMYLFSYNPSTNTAVSNPQLIEAALKEVDRVGFTATNRSILDTLTKVGIKVVEDQDYLVSNFDYNIKGDILSPIADNVSKYADDSICRILMHLMREGREKDIVTSLHLHKKFIPHTLHACSVDKRKDLFLSILREMEAPTDSIELWSELLDGGDLSHTPFIENLRVLDTEPLEICYRFELYDIVCVLLNRYKNKYTDKEDLLKVITALAANDDKISVLCSLCSGWSKGRDYMAFAIQCDASKEAIIAMCSVIE